MKRYESYKDSGVEWIGEIPSHWHVKKNKYFTLPIDVRSTDGDGELLSVSEYKGVVPRREVKLEGELSRSETLEGYKCVKPNQLVSNIMLTWKRGLGVSSYEGLVSPAYSVFEFVEGFPQYYHYLFRTDLYTSEFKRNSTGVVDSRLRLYDDKFGSIFSHYPPLPEQEQIVSFLDEKTSKIDVLIKKKEQKIELLKEYRTSLINRVITKGLNPVVPMKDSGVEWIGEIPSHWNVSRLKNHGMVQIGLSYSPEDVSDDNVGTIVLRSSNIQDGKVCMKDLVYVSSEIPSQLRVRDGDILICSRNGSRNLIGKNCLLTRNEEGMTWGVFMTVYRSEHPSYFYWVLNSPVFESQSGMFLTSTINQLTVSTLEGMVIPITPDRDEQEQIVSYLDQKTGEIDSTIDSEKKKIDLLKEYRQSLISSVITGKIKVVD
jgi:type I restriction enzyme S subunit